MSDTAPPAQQPRLSEGGAPAPPQPEVSASVGAATAAPAWDSAARRYGFLIVAAVTLCLLDQLTKYIITVTIGPTGADPGREIVVVPGFIFLRYIENTGMAFGLFRELGDLFIPIALAIMTAVVFYYRALRGRVLLLRIALALQMGGALGNLLDRVRLGYVVDFIAVPGFSVFNLADSAITVGVTVLILLLLFRPDG